MPLHHDSYTSVSLKRFRSEAVNRAIPLMLINDKKAWREAVILRCVHRTNNFVVVRAVLDEPVDVNKLDDRERIHYKQVREIPAVDIVACDSFQFVDQNMQITVKLNKELRNIMSNSAKAPAFLVGEQTSKHIYAVKTPLRQSKRSFSYPCVGSISLLPSP